MDETPSNGRRNPPKSESRTRTVIVGINSGLVGSSRRSANTSLKVGLTADGVLLAEVRASLPGVLPLWPRQCLASTSTKGWRGPITVCVRSSCWAARTPRNPSTATWRSIGRVVGFRLGIGSRL